MSHVAFAKSLGISPVADSDLPRASILKSLDYGNIARMIAIAGLSFLAYKAAKAIVKGEMAGVTLHKARGLLNRIQKS